MVGLQTIMMAGAAMPGCSVLDIRMGGADQSWTPAQVPAAVADAAS
jgi:hypothetical protein